MRALGMRQDISLKELMGKARPKLLGQNGLLRSEAYEAYLEMREAALSSGIRLYGVSGYRSFQRQQLIWNRKFKQNSVKGLSATENVKKIIEYSTIPGTSRHHWGTDVDLIDARFIETSNLLSPSRFEEGGDFFEQKQWMDENANTYGYYLVYTDKPDRKGFKYEPWHYSYKPLSKDFLKVFQQLDLFELLKQEDLEGKAALTNDFIHAYFTQNIMEINPELIP